MQENQVWMVDLGYRSVCLAFGIREKENTSGGPFSGNRHSNKSKGGGRPTSWHTRIKATETRHSPGSRPLLVDSQKLTGYVHQCIAELNEMEQLWIHFCYRDQCKKRGECWVKFLHKYTRLYEVANCQGARVGTRSIIREMIAWRMGQEAGEIPMGAEFESINGSISRQAWHKTYKEHWDKICRDLERVDQAALYKIGVKVSHQ